MKTRIRAFSSSGLRQRVTVLVPCILLLTSCEPELSNRDVVEETAGSIAANERNPNPFGDLPYPMTTEIRNLAGKSLNGTVLGKRGQWIAFRRDVDQREFAVDISTLLPLDVASLTDLPDGNGEEVDRIRAAMELAASKPVEAPRNRTLSMNYEPASTYEEARARAEKYGTHVLLVFFDAPEVLKGGVDKLVPSPLELKACKSFKRAVLNSSAFRSFASRFVETAVIDMLEKDEMTPEMVLQSEKVLAQYKVFNYPTVLLLTGEGREIGRIIGYDSKGPAQYVELLEELKEYAAQAEGNEEFKRKTLHSR